MPSAISCQGLPLGGHSTDVTWPTWGQEPWSGIGEPSAQTYWTEPPGPFYLAVLTERCACAPCIQQIVSTVGKPNQKMGSLCPHRAFHFTGDKGLTFVGQIQNSKDVLLGWRVRWHISAGRGRVEVALGRPGCAWFAIFGCSCVKFRRALSEQLCFQLAPQPQLEFCSRGGSFHREVTSQVVFPVVQAAKCLSHLFSPHS